MREKIEKREHNFLSEYATKSTLAKRKREIPKDEYRTAFQIDRDKIYHSTSFRRLAHKTQVFPMPVNDLIRTRLTHTIEVSQIARSIANGIEANEDLTEAIALGHDLGHTPFGHTGEYVFNDILKEYGGFRHNEHSVKVVEFIERDGRGLNLTLQTIDGIKNHGTSSKPSTIEGEIVRLSDKIAYVNHDLEDSISLGIIKEEDLKTLNINVLGFDRKLYVDTIIKNIIEESQNSPHIEINKEIHDDLYTLRKFLSERVYSNKDKNDIHEKVVHILNVLHNHFMKYPEKMLPFFHERVSNGEEKSIVVCDFLATMTDRYAISVFEDICIPKPWL